MALNHFALGAKIQAARMKRQLTQMELAERIDRSPTYLSYVENGYKGMSLETLVNVANALQVTADELLADSLESTAAVSNHTFTGILQDCSVYEQHILLDIATAAKKALRDHRRHFHKS